MRCATCLLTLAMLAGCGHPEGAHVFGRDGRYSLAFPDVPVCVSRPVDFKIVPALKERCVLDDQSAARFFSVEVMGFEATEDPRMRGKTSDLFASIYLDRRKVGTLRRAQVKFEGLDATDMTVQSANPPAVNFIRCIVAGDDVIIIGAGSYESESRPAEVTAFMDSLTIGR